MAYKAKSLIAGAALLAVVSAFAPRSAEAARETIVIPRDTLIYAQLQDDVTSKKKETNVGDVIRAQVWRDVVIDGEVVVERGAEMLLEVSYVKKARMLGRKGKLQLRALSVRAVDGSEIPLEGSYYQTGKGRKAATGTLAVAVAWPFVFLHGKHAVVPEGTVFTALVDHDAKVETWRERSF